eukprot:s127_g30.t1
MVRKKRGEAGRDVWYISQEGYVKDLLGRQSSDEKPKKVPISRDQSLMELDEKTPTPEKVRQCQKEVIESMNGGESIAVIVAELVEEIEKRAHTDSQSAIAILSTEGGSWRTRHLRMRSAYARQVIRDGDWQLTHVPGEKLVADLGTKSLSSNRLRDLKKLLGMEEVEREVAPLPEEEEVEREVAPLPEEEVENEDAPLPKNVEKKSAPRPEGRGGGIQEQSGEVAVALRLIALAATLTLVKGQEDEDENSEEITEFKTMMLVYTALVILVTLLLQAVWKVGVGKLRIRSSRDSVQRPRSLPAQEEEEPRPANESAGSSNDREPPQIATGSGGGDLDPRSGSLRGEDGSDGHVDHRVQLPRRGGEDESSDMSSSSPDTESSPPAGLNDRIERALEDIAREEAEMWAEIRRNPSQFENDLPAPEVNPLFLVLKTPCGTVYHIQRHCHHLLAPRVSPPRRYQWCAMCQMVSLATRGRPPPGIELHLSERTGTYHTDTRCPRNVNTLIYRVCLTCMSDQGAA